MNYNQYGTKVLEVLNQIVDERLDVRYINEAIALVNADATRLSARITELKAMVVTEIGQVLMDMWISEAVTSTTTTKVKLVVTLVEDSQRNKLQIEELSFTDPLSILNKIVDLTILLNQLRAVVTEARREVHQKNERAEKLTNQLYMKAGRVLVSTIIEQALTRKQAGEVAYAFLVEETTEFAFPGLENLFGTDTRGLEDILDEIRKRNRTEFSHLSHSPMAADLGMHLQPYTEEAPFPHIKYSNRSSEAKFNPPIS